MDPVKNAGLRQLAGFYLAETAVPVAYIIPTTLCRHSMKLMHRHLQATRLPATSTMPLCLSPSIALAAAFRPVSLDSGGHRCHFNLGGGKPLVHTAPPHRPGAGDVGGNGDYWPEPSSLSPGDTDIRYQALSRLPNLYKFSQPRALYPPYP